MEISVELELDDDPTVVGAIPRGALAIDLPHKRVPTSATPRKSVSWDMLVCPLCRLTLSANETTCPRDGHEGAPARPAQAPAALRARFKLVEAFGQGESGDLYVADDQQTGRRGLLKLLHLPPKIAPAEKARLKRELVKQATLSNPSLSVPLATGDADGVPWVFREWLDGVSLHVKLARGGALAVPEALTIAAQVAGALDELHRSGLLHRDVKPGHIMLHPQPSGIPRVTLIDGGIAARIESGSMFDVMGTPEYVSPEAARGKLMSFRSDLYALGCVLYEMLTGAPPFQGAPRAVLEAHVQTNVPALTLSLPTTVSTLLSTLLAKEPRDRPFSAQQVKRTLEPFAPEDASSRRDSTQTFESVAQEKGAEEKVRAPAGGSGTLRPPRSEKSTVLGLGARNPSSAPPPPPASRSSWPPKPAEASGAPAPSRSSRPPVSAPPAPSRSSAPPKASPEKPPPSRSSWPPKPASAKKPTPLESAQSEESVNRRQPVRTLMGVSPDKPAEQNAPPEGAAPENAAPEASAPEAEAVPQQPPQAPGQMVLPTPEPVAFRPSTDPGLGPSTSPHVAPPWENVPTTQMELPEQRGSSTFRDGTFRDIAPMAQTIQENHPPVHPSAPEAQQEGQAPAAYVPAQMAYAEPAAYANPYGSQTPYGTQAEEPIKIPGHRPLWPYLLVFALIGGCLFVSVGAGAAIYMLREEVEEVASLPSLPLGEDTPAEPSEPTAVAPPVPQPSDIPVIPAEPAGPQSETAPELAAPPEPARAEPVPEPVRPEPARAEPPRPEPARAEAARAEPARPEPARPAAQPARTERARPEPARPEAARPEPVRTPSARESERRQEEARTPERATPERGGDRFNQVREQALTEFRARRYGQAAELYEQATALNPNHAGSFAALGAARLALGQHDRAIRAYQRAITISPRNAGFHSALGRAYMASGDRDRARQSFQRALAIDPDNRSATNGLATLGG